MSAASYNQIMGVIVGSTRLRFGKKTLGASRRAQCVVAKTFAFATARQRAVNHVLPARRVKTAKEKRKRHETSDKSARRSWCALNRDKQMK